MATSLVHEKSSASVKSELDLFSVPVTQTGIESGLWDPHYPVSSLTDEGPIEFMVSGSGEDYIDLANTLLQIKAKITLPNGNDLPADANVGPINNWLHSLFRDVEVQLNGTAITEQSSAYPYKSYIENLLSYSKEAKGTQLGTVLWASDTHGHMDDGTRGNDGTNNGFKERAAITAASNTVEMMGSLHVPIFNQDRLLLNGVDMRVKLYKSSANFNLMAAADAVEYKTVIVDAVLWVRKNKVSTGVQMGHARALETNTAKYPIRRSLLKTHIIPRDNTSKIVPNLFSDDIPRRIIIGFVDNAAFDGNIQRNSFNFKHYNLTELGLKVDGHSLKPYKPDFREVRQCTREYLNLFLGTGKLKENFGNDVNFEEYMNGYTLYAFDLTPDLSCESDHFQLVRGGNVDLEVNFRNALNNPVCMIIYSEYDNVIEIDRARNIITDY